MDWTKEEISQIYNASLIELQYAAVSTSRFHFHCSRKLAFGLLGIIESVLLEI